VCCHTGAEEAHYVPHCAFDPFLLCNLHCMCLSWPESQILCCAVCYAHMDSMFPPGIHLQASIEHAKQMRYCSRGDCIVALHRIGNASVIKIVDIK